MKNLSKIILLIIVLFFSGCGGNIDLVKNGVLMLNDSITVGNAIEKWKVCDSVKWSEFVSDNGRDIVEANCKIKKQYQNDIIKYYSKNARHITKQKIDVNKIGSIFMDFQFSISVNSSDFNLEYVGLNLDNLDSLNLDMLGTFEYIYQNSGNLNEILNNTFEGDVFVGKMDDELDALDKEFEKDMKDFDREMQELDNMFNDLF
ncbi:hypothetical protein [Campylobacter corcagiensis]|uniref:Uncharacterized protein n=1 Tax=Campylobacter corcagiensis TaxID=1448857 RepID=A0A7M1LFW7_9BACT|nr:hypothetical protein [Campylobacter corcagiensis]QKF64324.1 hypothetical protein CCORG_0450 [Campylobacter corcagiensis]QOQ87489.1 hypothetical protein IMC76_01320 [Campylobacter corcagiensis]